MTTQTPEEAAKEYAGSNYNKNHFPQSWDNSYNGFIEGYKAGQASKPVDKTYSLEHIKRMCCWIFNGDYIHTLTNRNDVHKEIVKLVDLYSTFPQFHTDLDERPSENDQ